MPNYTNFKSQKIYLHFWYFNQICYPFNQQIFYVLSHTVVGTVMYFWFHMSWNSELEGWTLNTIDWIIQLAGIAYKMSLVRNFVTYISRFCRIAFFAIKLCNILLNHFQFLMQFVCCCFYRFFVKCFIDSIKSLRISNIMRNNC